MSFAEKIKPALKREYGRGIKIKERKYGGVPHLEVFAGHKGWLVFADFEDAESYAIERTKDMMEGDPGSYNLKPYMRLSPTDARVMVADLVNSEMEDLDDDTVVREAKLDDEEWMMADDPESYVDGLDDDDVLAAVPQRSGYAQEYKEAEEAGDADEMAGILESAKEMLAEELRRGAAAKRDRIISRARDIVIRKLSERFERNLEEDPVEFLEGMDIDIEDIGHVDFDEAAADYVEQTRAGGGIESIIAPYDGDVTEIRYGGGRALAYRQN